ncbi:MAG TPA: copper resistance protein CopC [Acidimicrobiales bacterium]|nr:copper resistance protein CopC [Acidimicrobiales bacterium]
MVALAAPAGAHTQVQDASPSPGEAVDGVVDRVELDWLDPLLDAPDIDVTGPDGAPVAGLEPASLVAPDVARATFDPLTEAGTYQVTYRFASRDGAPQEGAHTFSFTPDGGGGIGLRPASGLAVGVVVAGLVASAIRDRGRQTP